MWINIPEENATLVVTALEAHIGDLQQQSDDIRKHKAPLPLDENDQANIQHRQDDIKALRLACLEISEAEGRDDLSPTDMIERLEEYSLQCGGLLNRVEQLESALREARNGYARLVELGALPHDGWDRIAKEYISEINSVLPKPAVDCENGPNCPSCTGQAAHS